MAANDNGGNTAVANLFEINVLHKLNRDNFVGIFDLVCVYTAKQFSWIEIVRDFISSPSMDGRSHTAPAML